MSFINKIKNLNFNLKILILIVFDFFLIFFSSYFTEIIYLSYIPKIANSLLLYVGVSIFFFSFYTYLYKFYIQLNRFFGIYYIQKIFFVVLSISISTYLFNYLYSNRYFNLNFIILQNLLLFLSIFFSRIVLQKIYFHNFKLKKNINVVIFGAGSYGVNLYQNLKHNNEFNLIGFVDEDNNKIGRFVDNLKIFSIQDIILLSKSDKIQKCYLCIPSASSFKIRQISNIFQKNNIEIVQTKSNENNYKLPSEINKFNKMNLVDFADIEFKKKYALVTGAAGSIGQEICFQLNTLNMEKIYCLDSNEYSLASLKKKAQSLNIKNFEFILLDLTNKELLSNFFEKNKIDIIFHAAAHKHVDIVEENIKYSCKNNLLSILNILNLSNIFDVSNFIFISTDKAVRPSNVMGLTKRCGEILTYFYSQKNLKKNYSSVRFGNVIGSSGSLLEILKRQISNGGPITLTDKRASRYFMTISDAVSLVLKSASLKINGKILVLNMGDPINIYELIKSFLRENKLIEKNLQNKDGDIEVKLIGLRKGEKLHEELFYSENYMKQDEMIFSEDIDVKHKNINILEFEKTLKEKIIKGTENEIQSFLKDFTNLK